MDTLAAMGAISIDRHVQSDYSSIVVLLFLVFDQLVDLCGFRPMATTFHS